MKTTYALSICFVLAMLAPSVAPAYLPTGEAPYQAAIRQSQATANDKSASSGDIDKKLYVPSCTMDSSLSGKLPMDKHSAGDPSIAGKPEPDVSPVDVEVGSFRCQT
jgi:hypothetical protein